MRLTPDHKTDKVFGLIKTISDLSFTGVDRCPTDLLRERFYDHASDVFVIEERTMNREVFWLDGFAMVMERGGSPYLWNFAVHPDARGNGLGSGLLNEVVRFYEEQQATRIELTCKVDNPAQKLYFDHGFRAVRVEPKYYLGDGAGLVMRRTL